MGIEIVGYEYTSFYLCDKIFEVYLLPVFSSAVCFCGVREMSDWLLLVIFVVVFFVGVLVVSSWDPDNEDTLKILGIGSKYAVLFRKLCCSDAINGSLKIWKARSQPQTSSN